MREDVREAFYDFVLPISRFAAVFAREPRRRTHLSRLSASGHARLCHQELGQPAQIDRHHRHREHIADFRLATQLDLTDRRTMLLAIAEQRFDQLTDHLTDPIAFVARGAGVLLKQLVPAGATVPGATIRTAP